MNAPFEIGGSVPDLLTRIAAREYIIGVMGMGYVGLPLALVALNAGFRVIGFDIDEARVAVLNSGESGMTTSRGRSYSRRFRASSNLAELGKADAILIAVPTPLSKQREPDLTYVENSTRAIAKTLRPGQLIVLESTTWPGTTREVLLPILEQSGLTVGTDFFLAFSPEREDPGNASFGTATIPKVIGADDQAAQMAVGHFSGRRQELTLSIELHREARPHHVEIRVDAHTLD